MKQAPFDIFLLRKAIHSGSSSLVQHMVERLPADAIAPLLVELTPTEMKTVFRSLPSRERVTATLQALSDDLLPRITEALDNATLVFILEQLDSHEAIRLLRAMPDERQQEALAQLRPELRDQISRLLLYPPESAANCMIPDFIAVPETATVAEAIRAIRSAPEEAPRFYLYAVDATGRLSGVLSLGRLVSNEDDVAVSKVMTRNVISVPPEADQEAVARLISENDLLALPVVDDGKLIGLATVDDLIDVMEQEATEDIQKFGGMEALDAPYLQIAFARMVRKRAVWLTGLFIGEMLTATAMAFYEGEIARAVVLALFVPLIVSSGGNSGSQASTLVIRAMALGQLTFRDWWHVMRRELGAGVTMGSILGAIGFVRIVVWQWVKPIYGEHYLRVAATVFGSLVGVVTFGTLAGSLLPFILKRLGFDPASASAPLVATLVDVTGLVIYFSVAALFLRGTLL